jgi:hypothetical protein
MESDSPEHQVVMQGVALGRRPNLDIFIGSIQMAIMQGQILLAGAILAERPGATPLTTWKDQAQRLPGAVLIVRLRLTNALAERQLAERVWGRQLIQSTLRGSTDQWDSALGSPLLTQAADGVPLGLQASPEIGRDLGRLKARAGRRIDLEQPGLLLGEPLLLLGFSPVGTDRKGSGQD